MANATGKQSYLNENKEMMDEIIDKLKEHKLKHELPNNNKGEYNLGFVKAINIAINLVQDNVVLPAVMKRCNHCGGQVTYLNRTEHLYMYCING